MMSDYKVEMVNDGIHEFIVDFHGPKESMFYIKKKLYNFQFYFNTLINTIY